MFNILILIIVVILFAINYFYTENFSETISNPLDKFIGFDKTLNFVTKYNGKEYFLVAKMIKSCNDHKLNKSNDCMTNTLVLVEKNDLVKMLKEQKETDEDEQKICKLKHQLSCERHKSESEHVNAEIKSQCDTMPSICIPSKLHPSEFNLLEIKDGINKMYKLIGNVMDHMGKYNKHSMSTVIGFSNKNICMDGANTLEHNNNSSFELLEVPNKDSTEPSYMIRFKTNVILGNKHLLTDSRGIPVVKDKYVGICIDNMCDKKYSRLCLYDTESNPFVLVFTPKLIN